MDPATERNVVVEELSLAVGRLDRLDSRLIPQGGVKVVYAIRGARDSNGIAGIPGGVTGDGHSPQECAFGTDPESARIVLTAMKFEPNIRAAAVLRYSQAAVESLDDMFLECCSFNRAREPPGITTMDWGVASCCKEGVPDVIFDTGASGKEGLIRLFGEKPDGVVNNIIILSNRIMNVEL